MKQVLQDLRRGVTRVEEAPAPLCAPGRLRIRTSRSLISSGTERTLVDFARGSLAAKAMQQPQRVRQALDKMRTDGLVATADAIRAKLEEPMAVGYCNVGEVIEVGAGVSGFSVGDRVASNAQHAGVVVKPPNLCARIPEGVDDEAAAFTVLGAVAMQGIRLAAPTVGEAFAVFGLGVVGLLAVQILRANGCRVLAIDRDPTRTALAGAYGAEVVDLCGDVDLLSVADRFGRGRGVDGVLLTLSSKSSTPIAQAAHMCRRRGRVVLVGETGLDLNRADFYEKELTFQVSCSYGPGRYDPAYEDRGQDYPAGFVRWTEQRNFEAVLDLMAAGRIETAALVSHRFAVGEAARAYDVLSGGEPSLGILLTYPLEPVQALTLLEGGQRPPIRRGQATSVIGAGAYAGRILIDAFRRAGADLDTLVSAGGVSAAHHGRRAGFRQASTDPAAAIDGAADIVCIATRHDTHAELAARALAAGKHVFVEKPLALTLDELDELQAVASASPGVLMVGFNRRFAPMVHRAKALLDSVREPKAFVMTVNAGAVPPAHWTQDPAVGGGRLLGEGCHFIDLLRHLAGAPITSLEAAAMRTAAGGPARPDTAAITLGFADGSIGAINYVANGHRAIPKERLEVFAGGRTLALDNYLALRTHGWGLGAGGRAWRQDKGQNACVAAFLAAARGEAPAPIPADELFEVSRAAIFLADRSG